MSARPLLLLDVDGVLNPLGVQPPGHVPDGFAAYQRGGVRVLLCTQHGVWLTGLAESFDLAWATSWEHDADRLLADLVGLPRGLPVITFSDQEGWTTKLPEVIRFVGDRPAAWIDDVLGPEEHDWAASRSVPTLLVQTHSRTGLTQANVRLLDDFAASL